MKVGAKSQFSNSVRNIFCPMKLFAKLYKGCDKNPMGERTFPPGFEDKHQVLFVVYMMLGHKSNYVYQFCYESWDASLCTTIM